MTEKQKSWFFAVAMAVMFVLVSCIFAGSTAAAVIVDEDLIWSSSGSSFDTGGGFVLYEADRTDISGENISLETAVIQGYNPDFTGSVDYSLYDRARFSLWGLEYEVPFDYLASENNVVLAGVYAVAPSGTMYSNVDWGYSDSYYNGSVAYAFGFPGFDNAVNIPVTLLGNGTEIFQHVTVTEPLPLGGTYFTLERNGVSSLAEYYSNGVLMRSDNSADDWASVLAGPIYQSMRLDVTINGETQSVSWGAVPSPTPTPVPTNNTTAVPTLNINNNTDDPFGFDDWKPGGKPPAPAPLPDLPDVNIPNPDDFFDPFLNQTGNVTAPLFDAVDGFCNGFWNGLLGPLVNAWNVIVLTFQDALNGAINFFSSIRDVLYKSSTFLYQTSGFLYAVVPSVVWWFIFISVWGTVVVLLYRIGTQPIWDILRSEFDYWVMKDNFGRFK